MTPRLLLLQGAAVAASLFHVLIDVWIDIFGTGDPIAIGEALTLLSFALLYGWWSSPIAAATAGVRGAMLALAVLAFVWVFLGNGLAGFIACFPPCSGAFPWADGAHFAGVVFGGWAAIAAWRAYRGMAGTTQLAPTVTAVVLMLFAFITQATSFTPTAR